MRQATWRLVSKTKRVRLTLLKTERGMPGAKGGLVMSCPIFIKTMSAWATEDFVVSLFPGPAELHRYLVKTPMMGRPCGARM